MAKKLSGKLNILELHSSMSYAGGGQRNVFTFCKYLNRDIFNVYAGSYLVGGAHEAKFAEIGVDFVVGDGTAGKILAFIDAKQIDILHMHRSGHNVLIEDEIMLGAKKINPQIVIVEKNVFGKFDVKSTNLIACSFFQSMMHINERYLPTSNLNFDFDRMKVLYNSVDASYLSKFTAKADQITAYKDSLGIQSGELVLGKISSGHIAKWSDLVIDAMPYLIKLIPDVKFILVGVPKSRLKLINNSKYAKYFILVDKINTETEERLFYQSIDILAHSSKIGECNGNAINEAMYWKKPVVVNSTPGRDNGQLEQVVNEKNGLIANYPQTFARAIAYIFNNKDICNAMGEAGYKQVLTVNDPVNIINQFEKKTIEIFTGLDFKFENTVLEYYNNVNYFPSKNDILNYKIEYGSRLSQNFDKLTNFEVLINYIKKPIKFYFKICDFLEHKLYS
ncbi:MAG: glycosyltransferase family 4 protein [bacterium]